MESKQEDRVAAILFDFGGVVAEEGFRQGLMAIARNHGKDPDEFFHTATELIFQSGYVTGHASEETYWHIVRSETGVSGSDAVLRQEILSRFTVRPWIRELVTNLRANGYEVDILSDQTNWLEELDREHHFFGWFDRVFNSYHLGKAKRDPQLFDDVALNLGRSGETLLFIDDNTGNVERARNRGWKALLFQDRRQLLDDLRGLAIDIDLVDGE
jgi:putative hydrolase of the HAD superfamily